MIKEQLKVQLKACVSQIRSQKASLFVALVFFFQLVFFKELGKIHFLSDTYIRLILCGLTGMLFFYVAVIESANLSLKKKNIAILISMSLFTLVFFIWANDILAKNINGPFFVVQIPLLFIMGFFFIEVLLAVLMLQHGNGRTLLYRLY